MSQWFIFCGIQLRMFLPEIYSHIKVSPCEKNRVKKQQRQIQCQDTARLQISAAMIMDANWLSP